MAWCVRLGSSFGQFFPSGKFTGWDEELTAYFNAGLTEAEDAAIGPVNRINSYLLYVSEKFTRDRGPILDHEWPTEFKTARALKQIGVLFKGNERLLIVEDGLRALIERFEPGMHRFRPIKVVTKGGKVYPGDHHLLVIGQFVDCFSFQDSDPSIVREIQAGTDSMFYSAQAYSRQQFAKLAFKTTCLAGRHLWRETKLSGSDFYISDDLHEAILKAGFKFPKHYRVKDV